VIPVEPLLMGKYEVTWKQVRSAVPSGDPLVVSGHSVDGDSQPALVWYAVAVAFCRKYGFRLPTEDEWEWAARAGDNAKMFGWGKSWPAGPGVANLFDRSAAEALPLHFPRLEAVRRLSPDAALPADYQDGFVVTAPVGSFTANPFGLFDMVGNVWEFCGAGAADSSPASEFHLIKGGGWRSCLRSRLTLSNRDSSDHRQDDIGFRVVCELSGE